MATPATYKMLRDEVLANLDETGDTGTTYNLVNYYLNQAHEMRLGQYDWPFLRWSTPETFTTTSTRWYTLHPECWKVLSIYHRTGGYFLIEVSERNLEANGIDWNTDANRRFFRFSEIWPVVAQPSSTSVITIVSSSVSDTTAAKAITVRGVTANGITSESLTPNGTTSVAGTTSFTKILSVTKAAAWTGTLTMTSNSGAVTNLTLLPTEYGRQYQTIELLSTPTTGSVVEYSFLRRPTTMSADNDIPDIPFPYSRILVWDTLLMMAGYLTDLGKASLAVWSRQQQELEMQMLQHFSYGNTLGAQAQFIRDSEDYGMGWAT
jgi:hypothetical protein